MNVFNESDVTNIPQMWALCESNTPLNLQPAQSQRFLDKEVLGYYDAGMQVPDDITLLWTDDK